MNFNIKNINNYYLYYIVFNLNCYLVVIILMISKLFIKMKFNNKITILIVKLCLTGCPILNP